MTAAIPDTKNIGKIVNESDAKLKKGLNIANAGVLVLNAILGYKAYKNGMDTAIYAHSIECIVNYSVIMLNNHVLFRGKTGQSPNQTYQNNTEVPE